MEPTDEALVHACRRGDAAAWEALVLRYQRLVYSIPRRAGLDADTSADVFQQVFATLVEHLHRIEQPNRISAWLVTTARRETARITRRARVVASSVGAGSDGELPEPADTALLPEEEVQRLEDQHTLRRGVTALDPRCRLLLILLFYRPQPPSYAEIAAALGIPEGSIGPTRARCLQKLRRWLERVGL